MSELFVLDCSVTVAWCFDDEECIYSEKILRKLLDNGAIVPYLWNLEVTNSIIIAEKRQRITVTKMVSFLDELDVFDITPSSFVPSKHELLSTSRAYNLTSYDSLYLMLAMHERLPLATKDKGLMRACEIAGVELLK